MKLSQALPLLAFIGARAFAAVPDCVAGPDRMAEQIDGLVLKGDSFTEVTPNGWILRLLPVDYGWFLEISVTGREGEDISRLTPPWHFVPNPRQIEGWHFRNISNTAPNEGSVNAPGAWREFIFSPEVGLTIEYNGSATTAEEVEKVRSFGQGWLYLKSYSLSLPEVGARAAFESAEFSACLTWRM